ncbi:uncharacterized protein LOC110856069 isoform X2 [Folsomia candida]|uniref:uncharacterized protein LOC110856069 isoform X2 n=1 Tax=Folsomia candida TaxID=158441 RepID=UPI001604F016|nr:uncharacterized protein LOC110856069 isoform X2 [Folsomia candida]
MVTKRGLSLKGLLLGGLRPFQVNKNLSKSWTRADVRFRYLENQALFWTLFDLGTDIWYFLLLSGAILDPGELVAFLGGEEIPVTHFFPVFAYLILSMVSSTGVLLVKDQTFFPFSLLKFALFITCSTVFFIMALTPVGRQVWGGFWTSVVFIHGVYTAVKAFPIWAHVNFLGYALHLGLTDHLTRTRLQLIPLNVGDHVVGGDHVVEGGDHNTLEKFYLLKSAQLKHAMEMKAKIDEDGGPTWTENYYQDDAEGGGDGDEETGNGNGDTIHAKVWTVSDAKDKFLTRSVALDGDKFTIFDVQIAL